MRLITLMALVFLAETVFSQDIKSQKIDCYYIPWIIEPQWEYTIDEIRTCNRNSFFFTNSTELIDSLFYLLDVENLNKVTNHHNIKVRMVIDYYRNDSLINSVLIGKPHFAFKKYKYTKDEVKPPAVFIDGEIIIALFLFEINGTLYRSRFEFGKFLLENIPKANDW